MRKRIGSWFSVPARHHVWGSLAIVVFASIVISGQVADRHGFANGDLYLDVMDRWGTPIDQPSPSMRYVGSGTVFTTLKHLGFTSHTVNLEAQMNYRKRGLVYFSGFDFNFSGKYQATNPEQTDIDVVFVFPVGLDKNRVLLSELDFLVNDESTPVELADDGDKIVWTGRLSPEETVTFDVHFQGRGLDSFTYRLDPDTSVKNFALTMTVLGGDNYDYLPGVVPAHNATTTEGATRLAWRYPSLEAGTAVGAVLPSEKSFDDIIMTMSRRSWVPFLVFLGWFIELATRNRRRLLTHETYLLASGYGFFFVLLAYLAAFMNFYVAYVLSSIIIVSLLTLYGVRLLSPSAARRIASLLLAFLILPSFAAVLDRYTGLIYTIEILGCLAAVMFTSSREGFSDLLSHILNPQEASHEA